MEPGLLQEYLLGWVSHQLHLLQPLCMIRMRF